MPEKPVKCFTKLPLRKRSSQTTRNHCNQPFEMVFDKASFYKNYPTNRGSINILNFFSCGCKRHIMLQQTPIYLSVPSFYYGFCLHSSAHAFFRRECTRHQSVALFSGETFFFFLFKKRHKYYNNLLHLHTPLNSLPSSFPFPFRLFPSLNGGLSPFSSCVGVPPPSFHFSSPSSVGTVPFLISLRGVSPSLHPPL